MMVVMEGEGGVEASSESLRSRVVMVGTGMGGRECGSGRARAT